MLEKLKGILDFEEVSFLGKKYSELNHSVHSKRRRLNWNLSPQRITQNDFRKAELSEWSNKFISIVRFASELYLRTLFV